MKMVGIVDAVVDQIQALLEKYNPADESPPEYSRVHTGYHLYGQVLEAEFMQIKAFQLLFPKELVIIDLNGNWEEMTDTNYQHIDFALNLM